MAPPSDSMNHNDRLKGLSNREVGNALMSVSLKRPMPHEGEVCGYTPSQICYGYHVFNVCNVPVVQHIYDMHVLCCMMQSGRLLFHRPAKYSLCLFLSNVTTCTLYTRVKSFFTKHTHLHTQFGNTMTKACLMPFFRMTINTSHNKLYTVLCLCRARLWSSGSDWLNLSSCYKNIQTALCEGVGSLRLTVLQEKFISKALMWICCSSSCSFIDP